MSNEKRAPGCLVYIGGEISYPVMWGLFQNHYKDVSKSKINRLSKTLLRRPVGRVGSKVIGSRGYFTYTYKLVFPKIGVPQNGWFIMEKSIKMDDLGVPLFFGNTQMVSILGLFHPLIRSPLIRSLPTQDIQPRTLKIHALAVWKFQLFSRKNGDVYKVQP